MIAEHDPKWPEIFQREAHKILGVLGPRALSIEHADSTAVEGLAGKTDVIQKNLHEPALGWKWWLLLPCSQQPSQHNELAEMVGVVIG